MTKEQITSKDKIVLARFSNERGVLGELAKENDENINKILAGKRDTPLEVLKNLSSNDIYKDALNENYSFKKYEELMNDEDFRKRKPIEQETIIKMFRVIDDKEDISNNLCKIFINVDYEPLLYKMASYEKTPPEILEEFAKNKNYSLMLQVAENPNCPQNILEEFAERASLVKNEFLNSRLAINPNIPIEILEQLSKDESLKVKNIVLNNPSLTREIVENMSNDPNNGKELIGRCNEYLERLDKKEQSNDYDFER